MRRATRSWCAPGPPVRGSSRRVLWPIPIAAPRVNDRRVVQGERQRSTSAILPPYLRRSPRLAGVLPLLYLHGLSSGDLREALAALLGPEAAGLAPSTITRLTKSWTAEYEAFRRRTWRTRTMSTLGRRDSFHDPPGRRAAVCARADRSAAGREQGSSRVRRTAIGKAPRAGARCSGISSARHVCARPGDRRWCPRLLGRGTRSVA